MIPSDIANKLASDAASEIASVDCHMINAIGPDNKTIAHQIIDRVCCLKELFDIAESAERISFHNYCDGMLVDRIRTLKTKLKERNITL